MPSPMPDLDTPDGIIRLGSMFGDAKAVLSGVELGLFTTLHDNPATPEQVCERLDLHPRGVKDWLDLLTALGLLQREEGRYRNAPGADRHLVMGKPGFVGGFLFRANQNLYPAWGKLTDALRTGEQQSGSGFEEMIANPQRLGAFLGMMDSLTTLLVEELAEKFPFSDYGSILDVGGARGNVAGSILRHHEKLSGHVFDLPPMEPFFKEHVESLGVADRIQFTGGSFFEQPLPPADVVIIGHVLHDWDRDQRKFLIEKAYEATNAGGALVIYDRMLDEEPDDVENLVISIDMLLVTEGGSEYPASEVIEHAEKAGYTDASAQPLSAKDTLVVAHKP